MALDELYQEIILDHYKQPRNQGDLENPDFVLEGRNPLCGDEIFISVKISDGHVDRVAFKGSGCAISQASASIMTEMIKGKSIEEARELINIFSQMVRGEGKPENLDELIEIAAFQGVSEFPTRVKCALLAWRTLEEGIKRKDVCKHCEE